MQILFLKIGASQALQYETPRFVNSFSPGISNFLLLVPVANNIVLAFILLFWFVLRRPKLLKELNNRHNKELKELYLKKKNKLLENERKELSLLKKYVEMLYNKKLKKSEIKRLCLKKFSKELVGKYFK